MREDLHEDKEATLNKVLDCIWHILQRGRRPHLFQNQFQKDLHIGVTERFETRIYC